jgi:hypothetical protein
MHTRLSQADNPCPRLPDLFSRQQPTYHFSIDDVFHCLIEATDHYRDLFAHPFFRFLERMNSRYGACADLYLFNQAVVDGRLRTLAEVSTRFREQLQKAAWLRFGPHAHDYATPPHSQKPSEQRETFDETYAQIQRFAGPNKTTRWNRLHFFSECYELAPYFRRHGSDVLLLTDKPATTYRLSPGAAHRLRRRGWLLRDGLKLLQSHYRFEFFERDAVSAEDVQRLVRATLQERGYVSLFTHEIDLQRESVLRIAGLALQCAASHAAPADVAPLVHAPSPDPGSLAQPAPSLWTGLRYSLAAATAGDS